MKTASISQIKKDLKHKSPEELLELCLKLSKFKKENKEYMTYLMYESEREQEYIREIKIEVETLFSQINTDSFFYIKKSIRKILRLVKKYIRYSKKKETEVELLLHYCQILKSFRPSIRQNIALMNLYYRQVESLRKTIHALHEDLQFDYLNELELLEA